MARSYRHISMYEKEILELKKQGLTHQEIGKRYGLTKEHVKQFINRYNRKQRKLEAGIVLYKKGALTKDRVVTEEMKSAELRYIHTHSTGKSVFICYQRFV